MAAEANNDPNNEEVFVYMGSDMIVPRDVVRVRVHPSVTVIPNDAFDECVKLEDVEFCEGLLEIGKGAFHACTSLKGIKIPSTVTVICGRAFVYCSGLEEVELSEGLQEIREAAFFSCHRLKNIAIPTTVQQIGEAAFEEVPLQSIKLPDGLENIGPGPLLSTIVASLLAEFHPSSLLSRRQCSVEFDACFLWSYRRILQRSTKIHLGVIILCEIWPFHRIQRLMKVHSVLNHLFLIAWISSNYSVPLQILSTH